MKEFIYLASPYTYPDNPCAERGRYITACRVAARLLEAGHFVYAAIPATVAIAKHGELPTGYEFWREIDHELLRRFDKLVVLKISGWEESVGVQDEIAFMESLGKPVEYMEVDDV